MGKYPGVYPFPYFICFGKIRSCRWLTVPRTCLTWRSVCLSVLAAWLVHAMIETCDLPDSGSNRSLFRLFPLAECLCFAYPTAGARHVLFSVNLAPCLKLRPPVRMARTVGSKGSR